MMMCVRPTVHTPAALRWALLLSRFSRASSTSSSAPGGPTAGNEQVQHVIAVASGKGGVGKSTVAVNLAVALAQRGLRTGLLDADVYGPSVPAMMGVEGKPELTADGRLMIPKTGHEGVKVMSVGLLLPGKAEGDKHGDQPVVWRAPLALKLLDQMVRQVDWGPLDIMVIDMPPGTGDIQLSMSQRVSLSGALVVSTPQEIALLDARKAVNMFRRVDVPVLGFVENMNRFVCSKCGEEEYIFGSDGLQADALRLQVELLASIPLSTGLRKACDQGVPTVVSDPQGPVAHEFRELARKAFLNLGLHAGLAPHVQ
ncbi:Iron-sulfur cluster carrier protein [Porphyridium purpureum]|uniref:Iron-sulfur cluster carrier protein n=1 Tax=Porphyridium purpureum TaxID=35688 RepID=A0A5J4Z4D5_PORPP|nr:Iron-sulfur cluster carrier protein [Porphyridium purpureum]|eukprot:POR9732..scf295_1